MEDVDITEAMVMVMVIRVVTTAVICWEPPRGTRTVPWNVHALAPSISSPPCETGTTVPIGRIRKQRLVRPKATQVPSGIVYPRMA